MTQSRKHSAIEVSTSTFIGFMGSWLIMLSVVFYVKDIVVATTLTTVLCTVWSLARGYTIRRYFNRGSMSNQRSILTQVAAQANVLQRRVTVHRKREAILKIMLANFSQQANAIPDENEGVKLAFRSMIAALSNVLEGQADQAETVNKEAIDSGEGSAIVLPT